MSQHSENDSDDDDCEYFLQPVSNQYNITDKIKEANQQLYKGESLQRSSQPKVRFRDHQLVDYEPATDDEAEDDGTDIMERRSNSSNNSKRDEESSDDGYIDDETLEASCDERLIIEAIEIEEVSEQIEILQVTTCSSDNITEPSEVMEEPIYEEEFDEEADAKMSTSAQKSSLNGKKPSSSKKIFRSKINPLNGSDGEHIIRKTTKKDCCQYKETDEYKKKLPKYNGFYSHYGLSKDEYEQRETKKFENHQLQHRRQSRHIEQREILAKENEDAFAKWLYKKMRNSMSKTNPTNMYDIKPSAFMRKQRKQERKRQRQTIQRQMETDESCDVSVNDEDDDEDVGEEEEEEEDEENSLQQLNNE